MRKSDWILLFLVLSTFLIGFLLYPQLPEQIPLHWNIKGEVDKYGDKWFGTFIIPGMNLLFFILFFILPKIDPRKENYQKFKQVYTIFRWSMHLFLVLLYLIILYYGIKGTKETPSYLEVSFIVPFFVSLLFIIIGNYLGKIKDNFFLGIRTPWTLSSKEVWYKTHRLASKLFVFSGLLGIIGSLFTGMVSFIMLMVPLMLSVIYTIIYSYTEYQKEQRNG